MIDNVTMSTTHAAALGHAAYESGRGSSPLADREIRTALENAEAGEGRRVMRAFIDGWHGCHDLYFPDGPSSRPGQCAGDYDANDRCRECGEHLADPHAPQCPRADD